MLEGLHSGVGMQLQKQIERLAVIGPTGGLSMAQVIPDCVRRKLYPADPGCAVRKLQILAPPTATEALVLAVQSIPEMAGYAKVRPRRGEPGRNGGFVLDKVRFNALFEKIGSDAVSVRCE